MITVKALQVGMLQTNCYLICAEKECFLVDPGGDADLVIKEFQDKLSELKAIVLTHCHYDHIGAVSVLKEKYGCPVWLHEGDRELIKNDFQLGVPEFTIDKWLKDGDSLQLAQELFTVINTPGHTPGSICFYNKDIIFTGDTVFGGGYLGRTDLDGGSQEAMQDSVKKVFELPDHLKLYPGHETSSSLGEEKMYHNVG
jgi:hydroxyacylglutathione hydrolase